MMLQHEIRQRPRAPRVVAPAILASVAAIAAMVAVGSFVHAETDDLAALKEAFARPKDIPAPRDNPLSPERIALGKRLFSETRLSADDSVSCANCHNPGLAFGDGVALGQGITRKRLGRHTPVLWNMAWSHAYFWDGRAVTLEEQAAGPIENPQEMGQTVARGAEKLATDPDYKQAFAATFPDDPRVSRENILKALASYERTLVSPQTRFDRWIEGDVAALSAEEIAGFRLFTGKAGCINCHSGWNFTDSGFHDIGLPGSDLGRGPVASLSRIDHAFKTPGLRELVWTAPYMHNGSIATLDDVIRHYEAGGIDRPTRSPDLPPRLSLTDQERNDLVAFLESLSSDNPPKPAPETVLTGAAAKAARETAVSTSTVSQIAKTFRPGRITLSKGQSLTILNDDKRPHNVRVFDPRMNFDSGVQDPGEHVSVPFPEDGTFEAFCGIHPNMRLSIEVK